jgi:hypothetical protein
MPYFWIILGTVLIGVGGLVATYGWEQKSEVAKRASLARSVAAEAYSNYQWCISPQFTHLDERMVFAKANTSVLDGVIASGVFSGEADREFLSRCAHLRDRLSDLNQKLEAAQVLMITNPKMTAVTREEIAKSEILRRAKAELTTLLDYLSRSGYTNENETFYVELSDLKQISSGIEPPTSTGQP